MASNSLLIKQESQRVEWYYYLLKPRVHYYPVANDLSDLVEAVRYLEAHEDEALKIVEQANKFVAEHLTKEAMENYTCDVFRSYSIAQRRETAAQ